MLFLCTGNSCRSQMAEGWCRALLGEWVECFSAGTHPKGMDPRAAAAMAEVGIDLGGHRSKGLDALGGLEFDLVVTVCDAAHEACPALAGARRTIHHSFDDPPRLAADARTEAEAMLPYRRVRDEIRRFVLTLPVERGIESREGAGL